MSIKSTFLTFLGGATAFVCALFFWEAVARHFVILEPPDVIRQGVGHIHPVGPEIHSEEGFSRTFFDGDGLRGSKPKSRPKLVVLALGSSYTEADQVMDAETYCVQTQALLKKRGVEVWVANAGKNGGSPARYVAAADWYKKHIHPDRVVVQLDEADFMGQLVNHSQEIFLQRVGSNYTIKQNIGNSHRLGLGSLGSSLYRLAMGRLQSTSDSAKKNEATRQPDPLPLVEWTVENLKKAYRSPIIVYVPKIDYFGNTHPNPAERELADACRRVGIKFINMRSRFIENFLETGLPAHGFSNTVPGEGHMNAIGHFLVAQELAKCLGV